MSTDYRGLPETYRLPHEPASFNITPYFKVMSVLNVAQSEMQGREIRDLKEVVELRFAGDRNYSPVHLADEMSHKDGNRVITFAERFSTSTASSFRATTSSPTARLLRSFASTASPMPSSASAGR